MQTIQKTNQNSRQVHVAGAKRGKTRVSMTQLVFILLLIGYSKLTEQKHNQEFRLIR